MFSLELPDSNSGNQTLVLRRQLPFRILRLSLAQTHSRYNRRLVVVVVVAQLDVLSLYFFFFCQARIQRMSRAGANLS